MNKSNIKTRINVALERIKRGQLTSIPPNPTDVDVVLHDARSYIRELENRLDVERACAERFKCDRDGLQRLYNDLATKANAQLETT
jgi:hypothetical protein